MGKPTEDQVKHFIENVIGIEETFPTPNHEWVIEKFFETFFPHEEPVEAVQLCPGEQFCIGPDGSATINRIGGREEKFYPEGGKMSIRIEC